MQNGGGPMNGPGMMMGGMPTPNYDPQMMMHPNPAMNPQVTNQFFPILDSSTNF